MVAPALVEPDIKAGEEIIRALDAANVSVPAAFWSYLPDASRWRLFIASPLVDKEGPSATYRQLRNVIAHSTRPEWSVRLSDISVLSPKDEIVKGLRKAIQTGSQLQHVWIQSTFVDDEFLENVLVYRST